MLSGKVLWCHPYSQEDSQLCLEIQIIHTFTFAYYTYIMYTHRAANAHAHTQHTHNTTTTKCNTQFAFPLYFISVIHTLEAILYFITNAEKRDAGALGSLIAYQRETLVL